MQATPTEIGEDLARSNAEDAERAWEVVTLVQALRRGPTFGRPTAGREIPRYKRLMNRMPLVSGDLTSCCRTECGSAKREMSGLSELCEPRVRLFATAARD